MVSLGKVLAASVLGLACIGASAQAVQDQGQVPQQQYYYYGPGMMGGYYGPGMMGGYYGPAAAANNYPVIMGVYCPYHATYHFTPVVITPQGQQVQPQQPAPQQPDQTQPTPTPNN